MVVNGYEQVGGGKKNKLTVAYCHPLWQGLNLSFGRIKLTYYCTALLSLSIVLCSILFVHDSNVWLTFCLIRALLCSSLWDPWTDRPWRWGCWTQPPNMTTRSKGNETSWKDSVWLRFLFWKVQIELSSSHLLWRANFFPNEGTFFFPSIFILLLLRPVEKILLFLSFFFRDLCSISKS